MQARRRCSGDQLDRTLHHHALYVTSRHLIAEPTERSSHALGVFQVLCLVADHQIVVLSLCAFIPERRRLQRFLKRPQNGLCERVLDSGVRAPKGVGRAARSGSQAQRDREDVVPCGPSSEHHQLIRPLVGLIPTMLKRHSYTPAVARLRAELPVRLVAASTSTSPGASLSTRSLD